jgi:hypothetical protein
MLTLLVNSKKHHEREGYMTSTTNIPTSGITLPDHTQLPEFDGTSVINFQKYPQSILLRESTKPI